MNTPASIRRPGFAPRHALGTLLATTLVAIVATIAQPALAMPGGGHGAGHRMHGGEGPAGVFGHPRMAERLLDSVNASAEQRAQIRALVDAAQKDMAAQRESGRALREQAASLFGQPTVDARAAEALRQQMLAQHDTASKRMTQLMLDVSRVLTPEQRKQITERMAQRRSMMERHQQERRQLERPKS
jgi:Spy/CpxP family protein refolding chaperone